MHSDLFVRNAVRDIGRNGIRPKQPDDQPGKIFRNNQHDSSGLEQLRDRR